MRRPSIGIALGAGVARGWAHIGILKALARAGFEPDIVVGTSIGAVAGGCYVSNKLDALEDFATSLTRRRMFGFLDFNFAGAGLINGQRLCDRLETHLPDVAIESLDRKFVAVATELGTGHEIWLSKGRLVDAMRASYALPGIFRPVKLNNRWLIDGALVNPIPVSVCRALGARVVIAVNLNWDVFGKGAVISHETATGIAPVASDETEAPHGNGKSAVQLLQRQIFGKGDDVPGIGSIMMDVINITQDRIARSRLAGDPPDLTICPRLGDIGLFDFHRGKDAVQIGEAAAEKSLDDLASLVRALAA